MKILMTADTVGGVWTYAMELARALAPYGVQIALATMGNRLNRWQREQIEELPNVSLHESEFKLEWMEDSWADVEASSDWLLDLQRTFCADLVHLNGYVHAALPWNVPKLVVAHSCVLSWWLAVKGEAAPEHQWSTYRERVARGLHAADLLVAPSRAMLGSIQVLYGRVVHSSRVVPNGRDPAPVLATKKKAYVFAAGRLWDEAKNISLLRKISSQVKWPIYAAGNFSRSREQSNIPSDDFNFRNLGLLAPEDVAWWMSQAAIYCAPAKYEPFGLSILEAALSGCALVLGDIASLREIWDGAAVFVSPHDGENLAKTLNELIGNRSFLEKSARRARLRGLEFTPARMATAYLDVYREMLARQKASHSPSMEATACA